MPSSPRFIQEKEETEDEIVFFSSSSLIKKKKDTVKENKTLELLTVLGNNEIDITQFMEMELELVYKLISYKLIFYYKLR